MVREQIAEKWLGYLVMGKEVERVSVEKGSILGIAGLSMGLSFSGT